MMLTRGATPELMELVGVLELLDHLAKRVAAATHRTAVKIIHLPAR